MLVLVEKGNRETGGNSEPRGSKLWGKGKGVKTDPFLLASQNPILIERERYTDVQRNSARNPRCHIKRDVRRTEDRKISEQVEYICTTDLVDKFDVGRKGPQIAGDA